MGDFADLTLFDIYVCGPFMMAKAVKEQLILEKMQGQIKCLLMLFRIYNQELNMKIRSPTALFYIVGSYY